MGEAILQAPKTEEELAQERMQDIRSLYNAQLYKPLFGIPSSQDIPNEVVFSEIIMGQLGLAAIQHVFNILPPDAIEVFADRIRASKEQYLEGLLIESQKRNLELKFAAIEAKFKSPSIKTDAQKSRLITKRRDAMFASADTEERASMLAAAKKEQDLEAQFIESQKRNLEVKFAAIEAKFKGFSIETDPQKLGLITEERDAMLAAANEAMLFVYNCKPPIPFEKYADSIISRAEDSLKKNSDPNLNTADMIRALKTAKKTRDSEKNPNDPAVKALENNKDKIIAATNKMCDVLVLALEKPKDNPCLMARKIANQALEQAIGDREFSGGKSIRNDIKYIIFERLIEMNPADLETNKKKITKLCTQVINANTERSGFLGLFGDEMLFKNEDNKGIDAMLKASLAQFQQAPKQDVVARPNSFPAGMPAPSSPPVVDRSKTPLKPRPPTTPFPGELAARPASHKNQKEQPKVVTAASLEKWEQADLMPHGMTAPEWQKANPTKPTPPVPLAVPISRPRSDAIDAHSPQQVGRPSSTPPSITVPPIPAPSMRPKSEVLHASPPAPSESIKKNPVLEAEERSRKEIEGWRSSYESLGFVGRLGVSTRPESHKNLGQSVKAWREWHEDNKEYLAKKKFAIPAEYKDVMSKLQVAEDLRGVIGGAYSEENRGFAQKLKHLDDDAARLSILQKEAENKRASREAQLRSAPANIISAGDVQEQDTPYPPPQVSKVGALNKEREGKKGRSKDGGAERS